MSGPSAIGTLRGKRKLTLAVASLTDATAISEELTPPENPVLGSYIMGDMLGKGSFGSVYRGLNSETGEFVAIKQISGLRSDIETLKKLSHPNLVRFMDVFSARTKLALVIEYVESGSLASIVDNFGSFPEKLTGLYISQCLQGLIYLHENNVVHRDIKGANILITKSGQVKLTDFGLSKQAMAALGHNLTDKAPYWMAPEVIKNEFPTPQAVSDVWSLGCTIIELYTGAPPFYHLAPTAAVLRIIDQEIELPVNCSENMAAFLKLCLERDTAKRPTSRSLLSHVWLQEYVASIANTAEMLKTHVQENKDSLPGADMFRRMSLTPDLGGEAPLPSESRKIVKIFMPTIDKTNAFKTLYLSDRTTASTVISLALSKINGLDDTNPQNYYFCEVAPSTEERRFEPDEMPMLEYDQDYIRSGESQFHIKRRSPVIREGSLKLKTNGFLSSWKSYHFVLDASEKYFAYYERRPSDRAMDKAKDVIWSLNMIEEVVLDTQHPVWFHVYYSDGEWSLQAPTKEEAVEWVNELRHASKLVFDLGIYE